MPKFISDDEIRNMLGYHPPRTEDVRMAHEVIREKFIELGVFLNALLPEGPDKTITIKHKLRETMMMANATIAVAGKVYGQTSDVICHWCNDEGIPDPKRHPGGQVEHVEPGPGED
jgi:hypothetical protein